MTVLGHWLGSSVLRFLATGEYRTEGSSLADRTAHRPIFPSALPLKLSSTVYRLLERDRRQNSYLFRSDLHERNSSHFSRKFGHFHHRRRPHRQPLGLRSHAHHWAGYLGSASRQGCVPGDVAQGG